MIRRTDGQRKRWSISKTVGAIAVLALLGVQSALPEIDPSDLTKRADLVGREVVVDGRVQGGFTFNLGRGFNEFRLQKSPVIFRLPPKLSFEQPPAARVVRARGVLRKDGDRFSFDVTAAIDIQPTDVDRLAKGVGELAANDTKGREAWAAWAERRGAYYNDEELIERGRAVLGEALLLMASAPVTDPAAALALADRAKARHVPALDTSALAHRAFVPMIEAAKTSAEFDRILPKIEGFFPEAAKGPANGDLARWKDAYANDPIKAYMKTDDQTRVALDRHLWANAFQKRLELRAHEQPKEALALGEEAAARLPDRPNLAGSLKNQGLEAAANDVSTLRQAEVEELARQYREELKQPERAEELVRRWLDDQRSHRLSRDDAEGRVLLAAQYESMLGDKATAESLLREAWKIDPQSKATADVFRRKGYRLSNGEWVASAGSDGSDRTPADAAPKAPGRDPYSGLTRSEVRNILGKPDRVARSATQGQVVEQWIYQKQYITFVKRTGMSEPAVVSHYTLR
jgi:tetratricopeptide (TPR) repeat protein